MNPTYNLLTEPWIPIIQKDGTVVEKGLIDTLCAAHETLAIHDPSPLIQFGIYRFLFVWVTDMMNLIRSKDGLSDVIDLLEQGKFHEMEIHTYIERVGANRFDLFDPKTPFMQSPPNKDLDKNEKSVGYLFHHLPTGSNVVHFHHVREEDFGIAPGVAARVLCTIPPFMTSGGAGNAPSINGAPPWYVMILGKNLFETIVKNIYWFQPSEQLDKEEPVAWRSQRDVHPQEREKSSFLEGMTWRPRRIRLIPDDAGTCSYTGRASDLLIRKMLFSAGFTARMKHLWKDPHTAIRYTEDDFRPLAPQENRVLWRDTGPLVFLRKDDYSRGKGKKLYRFERPSVIAQYERLIEEQMQEEKAVDIEVYGLRTDMKCKYFEWAFEALHVPVKINRSAYARSVTQKAMEKADQVAYTLSKSMKQLQPDKDEKRKGFQTVVDRAQRTFWNLLRPHYDHLLEFIATRAEDLDLEGKMLEAWKIPLQEVSEMTLEEAIESIDAKSKEIQGQVLTRTRFWSDFRNLFLIRQTEGKECDLHENQS